MIVRTLLISLALAALAGCFVSPGDGGTSATSGTSATGGTSASTGSTGGCQVDSDCHKSNPDECNICSDMRLVCDQGACVCACRASGTSGSSGSSGSCWTDADCPKVGSVSQYCEIGVSACSGSSDYVTPAPGVCHRDCTDGSCTCESGDDCPVFGCDAAQGRCNQGGVFCPAAPPCPEGCAAAYFAIEACPFCLCSACPAPDAGSGPCGDCGPGSTCCGAQGGAESLDGGGPTYACTALEKDGGCPPGAVCDVSSSGGIESCNFYYP